MGLISIINHLHKNITDFIRSEITERKELISLQQDIILFLLFSCSLMLTLHLILFSLRYVVNRYKYDKYFNYFNNLVRGFEAFECGGIHIYSDDGGNALVSVFNYSNIVLMYSFNYHRATNRFLLSSPGLPNSNISIESIDSIFKKVLKKIFTLIIGHKKYKEKREDIHKLFLKMKVLTLDRRDREKKVKNQIREAFYEITKEYYPRFL